MYFVNHDKKIVIFWFHKCGHTSLIDFFDKIPGFELLEAWNSLDSYSYIEENEPKLLTYYKCMITRNPIHYSISGYKHFSDAIEYEQEVKEFFHDIILDRFAFTNYTLNKHLEICLSNDILFHKNTHIAKDFYAHCCRKQSYTYRDNVKIIHLEKIYQLLQMLRSRGVKIDTPFPHSNNRSYSTAEVHIDKKTVRLWNLLYRHECDILGYDFDSTVANLIK